MSWFYLILAGLLEIGFTTAMRLSEGFSRPWPTLLSIVFAALSLISLQRSLRDVPLGTAYAVWTGIGAAGTLLVGVWLFSEALNPARVFFLTVLVASIIGLKLFAPY